MAGLYLQGGLSGAAQTAAPQYGSSTSYMSGMGASGSAFAGPSTNPVPTLGQAVSPTHGFGLAVWVLSPDCSFFVTHYLTKERK